MVRQGKISVWSRCRHFTALDVYGLCVDDDKIICTLLWALTLQMFKVSKQSYVAMLCNQEVFHVRSMINRIGFYGMKCRMIRAFDIELKQ